MKRMMFLGALVLGVALCSESFGFELLNRMLKHGCCEPGCAADSCCEPGCDAGEPACDAGNGCCEPACDAGAGNGCCEPACDAGNGCTSCCGTAKKRCCLFGGLKGLFAKKKRASCCEPACDAGNGCCEPACGAGEPACDAGNGCCEPACDAGNGCTSCCGTAKKRCCHPIRKMLAALKARKASSCCGSCCGDACEPDCSAGCCEPDCGAGNGCCDPACGAKVVRPTPDASASVATVRTVATK